jgi:ATP-dependent protease HslVU (ClpYQ) peptidase subunit
MAHGIYRVTVWGYLVTAILAHVGKGYAIVGADRAISGDNSIDTYGVPKIVKRGGVIIGLAGLVVKGQMLLERWGVCASDQQSLSKHVQDLVKQLGGTTPETFLDDCSLVLVTPGRIYVAEHLGGLVPFANRWLAIGNGAEPARAAAETAVQYGETPRAAVRVGLKCAARMCQGVRGPFDVLTLGLI